MWEHSNYQKLLCSAFFTCTEQIFNNPVQKEKLYHMRSITYSRLPDSHNTNRNRMWLL